MCTLTVQKSIQLLKEMEYWALVINPQDCFRDTWGYHHYEQLRRYAERLDSTGSIHIYFTLVPKAI